MTTNYVIVVSVLEGNNFPVRHDKYLLVEAKFDGEVMSTDPVSHVLRPSFNTELAWEVDKKGLQMHRLQRSPVKLQWYALDTDLSRKETIGYIVLDIRLAQEKLQCPKWYPLLNSKYQREKPAVLLLLYLERATDDIPHSSLSSRRNSIDRHSYRRQSSVDTKSVNKSPSKASSHSSSASSVLKPILLSQAGCYQIGPQEMCTEKFVFSVTLAFAANLNKLRPPAMLKSSKGFCFYYCLFDNDVTTEKFSSLSNPQFQAERASVKICSSSKMLSEYFDQNSNLEIILCCGDISLGSGQIPLGPLSCVNSHDIQQDPLCIEGSVQIVPVDKTSRLGGDDLSPFVGVTVVLETEKDAAESKEDVGLPLENSIILNKCQPDLLPETTQKPNQGFVPQKILNREESDQGHGDKISTPPIQDRGNPAQQGGDPSSGSSSDTSPRDPFGRPPSTLPATTTENGTLHLSFSLDLCHFAATRLQHPIRLFIRYSYPFFGTTSSMITHPDVEVNLKRKVSIPHGYCVFNFASTYSLLKSTFWEAPLILEVLHRKKGGQEQLVGTAGVNLFQVLDVQSVSHTVDKKTGMRQMSTCKVVVTSQEGYEIGEIYAVLTLINFGPTAALCDHHPNKSNTPCYSEGRSYLPTFSVPPVVRQNGLIQDERLQAALELELWQERQREIFRAQLKDKEMQHLSVLSAEWKERDMERELMLQKQLQECQKLEDKLKITLKDAELKEKQLSSQEAELSLRFHKMDRQHEQQQKETKNKIESIKMEFNELLTLERLNVRELEQKNNSLLHQIKNLDKDLQDQRTQNEKLKSQVNKEPDVHLRTEVNILNMEKAELQQKLETALNSKQKYKVQWGQAVRQISVLQQRLHTAESAEREGREKLNILQQRIFSAEERNAVQVNEEILQMVSDKVESLKSMVSPESMKQQIRQMSLHNNEAALTGNTSHHNTNQTTSRSATVTNSNAKCPVPNGQASEKTNTNEQAGDVHSNPLPSKPSSLIPKPIKDFHDLNGNTPSKGDTQLQSLLVEKQKLLVRGYSEQHKHIQDLNAHIEKLAIK